MQTCTIPIETNLAPRVTVRLCVLRICIAPGTEEFRPMGDLGRTSCGVCGSRSWAHETALWPELVAQWRLSALEAAYIDRQQGTSCTSCGVSLRSSALGGGIASVVGGPKLRSARHRRPWMKVLEINEAGDLHRELRRWRRHTLARYPEVDIQALPYKTASFDLVVHSDTLEHVPNPDKGLQECLRVLRPGGWLCYTVPLVVGRLSGTREGLLDSFHGVIAKPEYLVITEFGADAWVPLARLGVRDLRIWSFDHPAAHALLARKPSDRTFGVEE